MIADEIQSGMARTGALLRERALRAGSPTWCSRAKGIAGGLPLAAVTGRAEIMDASQPGGLGGTFGGNPVACAAAIAVFESIEAQRPPRRGRAHRGARLKAGLERLEQRYDIIGEIRGKGAMIAIELVQPGTGDTTKPPNADAVGALVAYAAQHGVLFLSAGTYGNVLRFLPSLARQRRADRRRPPRARRRLRGARMTPVTGTFSVADSVELAVVERSGFIESRHAGSAVVLSPEGEVLRALGDTAHPDLPPVLPEAVPGRRGHDVGRLAPRRGRGDRDGQPLRHRRARRARARAPRPRVAADLGARLPARLRRPITAARDELVRSGAARERVYMNCSGKHAAMLLACVANDWPLEGYLDPEHPLQKRDPRRRRAVHRRATRRHGRRRLRRARCTRSACSRWPAASRRSRPRPPSSPFALYREAGRAHRGRAREPRGRSADPASPTRSRSNGSACSPRSAPRASWS